MFKWAVENKIGLILFVGDTEADAKQYIKVRNYTTPKNKISPLVICQYKMEKIGGGQ